MLLHSPKYHPKSRRAVERAVQIINGPLHLSAFGNVNNGIKRNITQQMWIRLLGAGAACDPECYSLPKVITIQKNTTYQQNLGWTHSACECFWNQVLLLHTVGLSSQVPGMFQGLFQCMDPGHQHTLCLQPSHSLTQWEGGCNVFTCQQILKHNGTQMHILPCKIELVHCDTTLFISESQCIIDKWLSSTVLNSLNTPNKIICKCMSLIPVVSTAWLLRQHHNIISIREEKLNNTMWEHSAQLFHTDSWSWRCSAIILSKLKIATKLLVSGWCSSGGKLARGKENMHAPPDTSYQFLKCPQLFGLQIYFKGTKWFLRR